MTFFASAFFFASAYFFVLLFARGVPEKRVAKKGQSEAEKRRQTQRREKGHGEAKMIHKNIKEKEKLLTTQNARWIAAQPIIAQGSDEWHFVRTFGLTASNVATALHCGPRFFSATGYGGDRFEMAENLLKQKSGFAQAFSGNASTEHGVLNEPVALESFATRHQKDLFQVGLLVHPRYRWLGASPDAVLSDGTLLEIKVPKMRSFKVGDPVEVHYWIQCQTQMEVCGAPSTIYSEYRVPSTSARARIKEPRINEVFVKRDKEFFDASLPLLLLFVEAMYRLRYLHKLFPPS